MLTAVFADVNGFQSDQVGQHIRIAVVDSALDMPADRELTIESPQNYVASTERDTTGHGTKIIDTISPFAPNAIYNPLRVIAEDREFRPSNFLKAMEYARTNNLDVVNISAGKYHTDCGGRCRICKAAERVTGSNSVVIAGAGNRKQDQPLDVFCPGRSGSTISVGMSETLCTASPPRSQSMPMDRSDIRPPGAYWVKMDADSGFSPDDSYCSYRRCSPFQECENNRKTVYWDGNVDWDDYLPEIVAPGHRPLADVENGFFAIEPGTSYSTAVVSGSIATILSELFPNVPSPQRIKRSVEASAQELDCGIVGKLDMKELYRTLS